MQEVTKPRLKSYGDLQKNIEASFGEQASIRVSRPLVQIECKYLDEVTTKEEIYASLRDQLKLEDGHCL